MERVVGDGAGRPNGLATTYHQNRMNSHDRAPDLSVVLFFEIWSRGKQISKERVTCFSCWWIAKSGPGACRPRAGVAAVWTGTAAAAAQNKTAAAAPQITRSCSTSASGRAIAAVDAALTLPPAFCEGLTPGIGLPPQAGIGSARGVGTGSGQRAARTQGAFADLQCCVVCPR